MPEQEWQYEGAADLDQTFADRLRSFPRQPDMLVYGLRSMAALSLRAWLRVYHRLTIVGRENLPSTGSFVLVANHSSHLDALCLISALPLRKLHRAFPAAGQDYFFSSLPRATFSAVFMNALPFGRQVHIRQSLALCRRLLDEPGNILILFPEGTRSTTGLIGDFRAGIGMLVAGSGVPVVPCGLRGAGCAWPKGSALPRPRAIRLIIGKPRFYADLPRNRGSADGVARDLKSDVEALACG